MSRTSLILCLAVVVATASLVSACDKGTADVPATSTPATPSISPEGAGVCSSNVELSESFDAIEAITLAAATRPEGAVVVGTAEGVDDDPEGMHLAESVVSFHIEQVLSGDLQQSGVIPVVENGGIILDVIKPDSGPTTTLEYLVQAGVPVMRSGERWLLFLTPFEGPVLPDGGYTTLGAYQGKFKIGDDGIIRFTGPEECLSSPGREFALAASVEAQPAAAVIAKTEALVAAAASQ